MNALIKVISKAGQSTQKKPSWPLFYNVLIGNKLLLAHNMKVAYYEVKQQMSHLLAVQTSREYGWMLQSSTKRLPFSSLSLQSSLLPPYLNYAIFCIFTEYFTKIVATMSSRQTQTSTISFVCSSRMKITIGQQRGISRSGFFCKRRRMRIASNTPSLMKPIEPSFGMIRQRGQVVCLFNQELMKSCSKVWPHCEMVQGVYIIYKPMGQRQMSAKALRQ